MPVAAAGLADIGAGDAQPLMLGGRRQHALQQLAVVRLQLGLLLELPARYTDSGRQRVANSLQVPETQCPWLGGDGGYRGVDLQAREGVGEEGTELVFEAADLASQLGPGEPFVTVQAKRAAGVSIEQIRHSPTTSVNHATHPIAIVALSRRRA